MKTLSRFLAVVLCIALALSLCACGHSEEKKAYNMFSLFDEKYLVRRDSLYAKLLTLSNHAQQKLSTLNTQLSTIESRLPLLLDSSLKTKKHQLELLEEKVKTLDPSLLLRRGYSITLKDGKAVRDAATLHPGDEIKTRFANGSVHSIVK